MYVHLRFFLLIAVTAACNYKGVKHADGEKWVVRGTFVVECHIYANGSWKAEVIGCRTHYGKFLYPGENYTENDTRIQCSRSSKGTVKIQRNYGPTYAVSCEGHEVGESWISKRNFNKTCVNNGTRISNCLTDTGIPIPLNSTFAVSGVKYTCTSHSNGTVTILRESDPSASVTKRPKIKVTCNVKGVQKSIGETWIEDGKFMKKCDENGGIAIDACVLNDQTRLEINSNKTIDGKVYVCTQNADGTVLFRVDQA